MTKRDDEEIRNELNADMSSDYPSSMEINCSDSESNSLSKDSYESESDHQNSKKMF